MTLPFAVICPAHGQVFLADEEYESQMDFPYDKWKCPTCGLASEWDDENYQAAIAEQEAEMDQDERAASDSLRTLGLSEADFR